ncbi:MAG: heme ABC transporter ATP-binding protein [Casimicrobiaceae bacterium]
MNAHTTVLAADALVLERAGRRLLDQVSLAIAPGETVALVGPNGAGKSTLLRAITGEWPLASGEVWLFGEPLAHWRSTRLRREALARRLAMLTQQPRLDFDFTVAEVVALGRLPWRGAGAEADRRVVDDVLARLGLASHATRRYLTLSGGERQRVQFARVLVQIWANHDGGLLLLDEPTSALDLAQQVSVLDAAVALRERGIAVAAVVHDLNAALGWFERAVLLAEGRIVADGPAPASLHPETVERVYGVRLDRKLSAASNPPVLMPLRPAG